MFSLQNATLRSAVKSNSSDQTSSSPTTVRAMDTNKKATAKIIQLTPEEEEKIIKDFVNIVNEIRAHQASKAGSHPITIQNARKFLSARKFELQRALALYKAHEMIRLREGLVRFDLNSKSLRNELFSGKFTVLPNRDPVSGCCITLFSAYKHDPLNSSHQITLQSLVLQLDVCISSVETQNNGIVFIYNMNNSKYSNFDYELSQKILVLLKGAYPARLKKVLIVTPPLWFKTSFKILRLFVREKLRDRVYMLNQSQLKKHLPLACLPKEIGGELKNSLDLHDKWINHCLDQIKLINLENNLDSLDDLNDLNKSFMFNCDLIGENISSYDTESDELDDFNKNSSEIDLTGLSEQITRNCDNLTTDFEQNLGIKTATQANVDKLVDLDENKKDNNLQTNGVTSNQANNSNSDQQPIIIKPSLSNRASLTIMKPKPENIPITKINCDHRLKAGLIKTSSNGYNNGMNGLSVEEDDHLRLFRNYLTNNDRSLHLKTDPGMTLNEFILHLRTKGRKGLFEEYSQLRHMKNLSSIFNNHENLRRFSKLKESLNGSSNKNNETSKVEKNDNEIDLEDIDSKLNEKYNDLMCVFTFENSLQKNNVTKNRYTDVLCYDHSRVILKVKDEDDFDDFIEEEPVNPVTDYINANYVDGYEQPKAFISTQGPLNSTCVDFYEMCIQNEVKVVVMTTRTMEGQRIKCAQYWPSQENAKISFSYLTVINNKVEEHQDYIITRLTIKDNSMKKEYNLNIFNTHRGQIMVYLIVLVQCLNFELKYVKN